MRNININRDRSWAYALATVLTTGLVAGCSGGNVPDQVCGLGTQLNELGECVLIECAAGQRLNPEKTGCIAFDPCESFTCQPLPNALETVKVSNMDGTCGCAAQGCQAGYSFSGGFCTQDVNCPSGMIQEGNNCIFDEGEPCAQNCDNPLCYRTACDEVVGTMCNPGSALEGQTLEQAGLCVPGDQPTPESCTNNCHNGIENPHPWFGGPDLSCTGCHGGTPDATTRQTAHVAIPAEWQVNSPQWGRPNLRYYWNYNTLFGVENFSGGLEWLRFRNPSDLRVAEQSCGKNSGCHQDRVENVKRSVMATAVGLVGVSQARNGIQRTILEDGGAIYKFDTTTGMTLGKGNLASVTGPDINNNYVGAVAQLTPFSTQDREDFGAYNQVDILKETYDKQCGDCHLGSAGANNRYADFRSSGCASCHMPYALDGRSRSSDPMISKVEPTYPNAYAQIANYDDDDLQNLNGAWLGPERSHPIRHQLTLQMSSQRCGSCHVGSNRTDWQFRGYIIDPNVVYQTGLDNNNLNANQVRFTNEIDNIANPFALYHGQAQNQVAMYLDLNNDGIDDIPADIHFQSGMECMDCHTSGEMHNELKFVKVAKVDDWDSPAQVEDASGAIWSHMDQSTEVECVHCHGNLEYRALSYEADNRNPIKNLIVCPENNEVIANYTPPAECSTLGAGRWMKSKFTGNWHYTPQTYDTVNQGGAAGGGAVDPRRGAPIYTQFASVFHGRFDGNNFENGIGPCENFDANNCFQDQANNQFPVTQGFSHLGDEAQFFGDQQEGGLECYACHATWSNNCFGCHLRIVDNDGNALRRQYAPSTGELTLGQIFEADFTSIAALDMQYGINSEGKISQFLPETKQMLALTDYNENEYFGTQVIVNNDANIQYNVYRDRMGYGLRLYDTEVVGLPPNSDGLIYEQNADMDQNAGQGSQQMMPHSVQRTNPLMDCANCHIDENQNNTDFVLARWMANPNGFANVSDYLQLATDNGGIVRNNSNETYVADVNVGHRFDANTDPTAFVVDQQSDWCVYYDINNENLAAEGFPFCYNNHPMREANGDYYRNPRIDPQYARAYPEQVHLAGPLNTRLMTKMFNRVLVNNYGVAAQ